METGVAKLGFSGLWIAEVWNGGSRLSQWAALADSVIFSVL